MFYFEYNAYYGIQENKNENWKSHLMNYKKKKNNNNIYMNHSNVLKKLFLNVCISLEGENRTDVIFGLKSYF